MPWSVELSTEVDSSTRVHVVVGILVDRHQQVLVSQRPAGKHLAGAWEFPGGKLEQGEAPYAALCRELDEELGIKLGAAEQLMDLEFAYPDRVVWLDVWWVTAWSGKPLGQEAQNLRWVGAAELAAMSLLPADEPIVAAVCERIGPA